MHCWPGLGSKVSGVSGCRHWPDWFDGTVRASQSAKSDQHAAGVELSNISQWAIHVYHCHSVSMAEAMLHTTVTLVAWLSAEYNSELKFQAVNCIMMNWQWLMSPHALAVHLLLPGSDFSFFEFKAAACCRCAARLWLRLAGHPEYSSNIAAVVGLSWSSNALSGFMNPWPGQAIHAGRPAALKQARGNCCCWMQPGWDLLNVSWHKTI